MARYDRITQKVFAGNASNNGVFGSAQDGSKVLSNVLPTLMSLPAWESGWLDAVLGASKFPPLEEFQSSLYVHSAQVAYLLQQGIPEYDVGTTYYTNNIVVKAGTYQLYGSKTNGNVGNALSDTATWQFLGDLSLITNQNVFTAGLSVGTVNAQTVPSTSPPATSYTDGQTIILTAGLTNTSSMTFGASGETPIIVKKNSMSGLVALSAGDWTAGNSINVTKNTAGACWVLAEGLTLSAMAYLGISGNSGVNDGTGNYAPAIFEAATTGTNKTYATSDWGNLNLRSNSTTPMADTLPGTSGALPNGWYMYVKNTDASAPIVVAVGAGGSINQGLFTGSFQILPGETWLLEAQGSGAHNVTRISGAVLAAAPTQSAHKNLKGDWLSNTTASLTADEVIVEDSNGNSRQLKSFSQTFNSAASVGATTGLDTGSFTSSTWYYGFAIFNPSTNTQGCIFSASSTSPVLPSGFTMKSGALTAFYSDGSSHFIGFKQRGNDYQYTIGNNLSAARLIVSGGAGSPGAGTYVASAISTFVPTPIASTIKLYMMQATNTGIAAPNNSYGAFASTTNPPPMAVANGNQVQYAEFLLESTNIYYASDGSAFLFCLGFKINL